MTADTASVVVALVALIVPLLLAWWLLHIQTRQDASKRNAPAPAIDKVEP